MYRVCCIFPVALLAACSSSGTSDDVVEDVRGLSVIRDEVQDEVIISVEPSALDSLMTLKDSLAADIAADGVVRQVETLPESGSAEYVGIAEIIDSMSVPSPDPNGRVFSLVALGESTISVDFAGTDADYDIVADNFIELDPASRSRFQAAFSGDSFEGLELTGRVLNGTLSTEEHGNLSGILTTSDGIPMELAFGNSPLDGDVSNDYGEDLYFMGSDLGVAQFIADGKVQRGSTTRIVNIMITGARQED